MTIAQATRTVVVAGNPNAGKTTLFNRLTGGNAHVANYPGVTVELHEGTLDLGPAGTVRVLDIPGTYSLSARSAEEQIAIRTLAGLGEEPAPALVVMVVDATQLLRNLYLVLQVLELGVPVVVALNMTDLLAPAGLAVDVEALARELGVPVIPVAARKGEGLDRLRTAVGAALDAPGSVSPGPRWVPEDAALRADIAAVTAAVPASWHQGNAHRARAVALWSLLSCDEDAELGVVPPELMRVVAQRRVFAAAAGREIEHQVIEGRYRWIDARADQFLRQSSPGRSSLTDRVDRLLLHPVLGFALFLVFMTVVFQSLFSWADPAISLIEGAFAMAGTWAAGVLPAGLVSDFVVNGLIQGIGSVLVFLPQILLLFLFIGLMEDTGYMARVAFLMDRVMKAIGLHGRAFVPMMSGYACAIPAILATRTMERKRDRLLTMMVVPLMTCSARLPVYGLLVAAMYPPGQGAPFTQGLLMAAMYLFSTAITLVSAAVLGRTVFKGPRVPLLMEMPPYRIPHWPSVVRMVWERSMSFVKNAGTVILACVVVMWVLKTFPRDEAITAKFEASRAAVRTQAIEDPARTARLLELDRAEAGESLRHSYAGRIGQAIEPALRPLGFDWKIGIGIIGAFAAREVFVGTMGVVYGVGGDEEEQSGTLRERMAADRWPDGRRVFTPLVCLSLMVFFALACQCMSTLAVVRRETGGWGWPAFLFAYMTGMAWVASFLVYQGGMLLGM
jgi:ferrous iron transport protein B